MKRDRQNALEQMIAKQRLEDVHGHDRSSLESGSESIEFESARVKHQNSKQAISTFVPSKRGVQSTADLADKNYDEVIISNIRPVVQKNYDGSTMSSKVPSDYSD